MKSPGIRSATKLGDESPPTHPRPRRARTSMTLSERALVVMRRVWRSGREMIAPARAQESIAKTAGRLKGG